MKKFFTISGAVALAFGLAACGSSSTDASSSSAESSSVAASTEATTQAATEEANTETADSGVSAETTTQASGNAVLTLTVSNTGKGNVSWGIGGSLNSAEFEGEWTQRIELTDKYDLVTLSVTGDFMSDSNELKCTITDSNGRVVDEATGTGASALASCSYSDSF